MGKDEQGAHLIAQIITQVKIVTAHMSVALSMFLAVLSTLCITIESSE